MNSLQRLDIEALRELSLILNTEGLRDIGALIRPQQYKFSRSLDRVIEEIVEIYNNTP